MRRQGIVVVLLAILLSAPLAASWSSFGSWEPDTSYDAVGDRMWPTTDRDPLGGGRVYFNAMVQQDDTGLNPNTALLQGRAAGAGSMQFTAILGLWRDCNDDNYVGAAESALLTYRNEALLNKVACPENTRHNRGGWVSELIYIGNRTGALQSTGFPKIIKDPTARVWGDFGRPGETEIHLDCPQGRFPLQTFDSTGGLLRITDCQIGYNIAKTVNALDAAAGGAGLAFDDVYHPERDCNNPLNQPTPGGVYGRDHCARDDAGTLEEDSGSAAFTVFDCGTTTYKLSDPTSDGESRGMLGQVVVPDGIPDYEGNVLYNLSDEKGTVLRVPGTGSAGVHDPEGSYADGLSNVYQGGYAGCDPEADRVYNSTELESNDLSVTDPTDGKRLTDFPMDLSDPGYGLAGVSPQNMPTNAGVRTSGGHYTMPWTYIPPTYLGPTVRSEDLRPAPALWFTFYAYVSPVTTDNGYLLPSSTVGTYGFENCGNVWTGVRKGWDCDPDNWWNEELGGTSESYKGHRARPGAIYQLRDVDCYDGTIAGGVPAKASLADVSEAGACPALPAS